MDVFIKKNVDQAKRQIFRFSDFLTRIFWYLEMLSEFFKSHD